MSGHTSWQSYYENRLRRMIPERRAAYEVIQAEEREKILHQVWLVGVEGWLSRALNDARLGRLPESLAWPVRTLGELAALAAKEYPACAATSDDDLGKFANMTWKELRREANVRLLDEYWRLMDEADTDTPPEWKKSDVERRNWAESVFDRMVKITNDPWPEWEHDAHGRSPDDAHYGHDHE